MMIHKKAIVKRVITKQELKELTGKQQSLLRLLEKPRASNPELSNHIYDLKRLHKAMINSFNFEYTKNRRQSIEMAYKHMNRLEDYLIKSIV